MRLTYLLAAALAVAVQPAVAQTWPSKPVKIIIPYGPGGPTASITRIISDKLTDRWKQPTLIENRPGAGSNIGTAAAAKAPPDGYTLLVNTSAIAVNQTMFKAPGYDTLKDFVPIVNLAQSPNMIVGSKSLKATNLKGALEEARTAKYSYGSPGTGTTPHLSMEYLVKVLAKVDVVHVPFKGAGDMNTAALAGTVQFVTGSVPTIFAIVKSGDARGLAVTSAKRAAALPDVPTFAEAGFPGVEDYTWIGLFAPAGTPPDIVAKLSKDVNDALASPDVKALLSKIAFDIVGGPQDAFAKYVAAEVAKWGRVVKAIGVPPM